MAGDGRPAQGSAHSARPRARTHTREKTKEGNRPTGDDRRHSEMSQNKKTEKPTDWRRAEWPPAVVTWWVTKKQKRFDGRTVRHMDMAPCDSRHASWEFEPVCMLTRGKSSSPAPKGIDSEKISSSVNPGITLYSPSV